MLAEILSPMSTEEFFREYWTKRFVHIAGAPEKFQRLFSWDVLSRVLDTHRFVPPRLKLVKAGLTLNSSKYIAAATDTVDGDALLRELASGATLILNSCEEVHEPLRQLCAHLERLFHVYVYANLYAGWRKDNGFNVHWDDQDTLILQVSGRKHWKVWAPARPYPFHEDLVDTSSKTKPDGPPLWEGVIEQGGMLSMPRGWWHVAYPMDEPSLHLTVTIKNLNGIDLLRWLAHRMKGSETARMELPIMASREARLAWLHVVWRDLCRTWNDDLFDDFLADVDALAKPRPRLRLPEIGAAFGCEADLPLELAKPRSLQFEITNGTARFKAGGGEWETTSDVATALGRFNDGLPHTLAEISPHNDRNLTLLITALMMRGVVRPVGAARA